MLFSYQTIKNPVTEIVYKEKGSKFIGFGIPVRNENEFKQELEKIKNAHPKATHHCYAYRFGISGEEYRANDDGEPSGSAGLPIYNQLLAHEISDILVVVVRYYGGTKLGVAGLIKAYKECAKVTLEDCEIITKELETEMEIEFEFEKQNQIFTLINKIEGKIVDFLADEQCKIKIKIHSKHQEKISEQLSEMKNISFKIL